MLAREGMWESRLALRAWEQQQHAATTDAKQPDETVRIPRRPPPLPKASRVGPPTAAHHHHAQVLTARHGKPPHHRLPSARPPPRGHLLNTLHSTLMRSAATPRATAHSALINPAPAPMLAEGTLSLPLAASALLLVVGSAAIMGRIIARWRN